MRRVLQEEKVLHDGQEQFHLTKEKAPRQCLRLSLRIRRLCVVHVGGEYCVAGCVVLMLVVLQHVYLMP